MGSGTVAPVAANPITGATGWSFSGMVTICSVVVPSLHPGGNPSCVSLRVTVSSPSTVSSGRMEMEWFNEPLSNSVESICNVLLIIATSPPVPSVTSVPSSIVSVTSSVSGDTSIPLLPVMTNSTLWLAGLPASGSSTVDMPSANPMAPVGASLSVIVIWWVVFAGTIQPSSICELLRVSVTVSEFVSASSPAETIKEAVLSPAIIITGLGEMVSSLPSPPSCVMLTL